MPKKTLEQKTVAAYRRKLKLLESQLNTNKKQPPIAAVSKSNGEIIKTPFIATLTADEKNNRQYFLYDLKKSTFVIIFIIVLEIIVYYASIKGYFGGMI